MAGLLDKLRGYCASASPHQMHFVANGNLSAFDYETVKRKLAVEASVDASGDFLILYQGIRVV